MNEDLKPVPPDIQFDAVELNPSHPEKDTPANVQLLRRRSTSNGELQAVEIPYSAKAEAAQQETARKLVELTTGANIDPRSKAAANEIARQISEAPANTPRSFTVHIPQTADYTSASIIGTELAFQITKFSKDTLQVQTEEQVDNFSLHISQREEEFVRQNLVIKLGMSSDIHTFKATLQEFQDLSLEIAAPGEVTNTFNVAEITLHVNEAIRLLTDLNKLSPTEQTDRIENAAVHVNSITRSLRNKVDTLLQRFSPDYAEYIKKMTTPLVPNQPPQTEVMKRVQERSAAEAVSTQPSTSEASRTELTADETKAQEILTLSLQEDRPTELLNKLNSQMPKLAKDSPIVVTVASADKVRSYNRPELEALQIILTSWLNSAKVDPDFSLSRFEFKAVTSQYDLRWRIVAEMIINAKLTANWRDGFSLDDQLQINKYLIKFSEEDAKRQTSTNKFGSFLKKLLK